MADQNMKEENNVSTTLEKGSTSEDKMDSEPTNYKTNKAVSEKTDKLSGTDEDAKPETFKVPEKITFQLPKARKQETSKSAILSSDSPRASSGKSDDDSSVTVTGVTEYEDSGCKDTTIVESDSSTKTNSSQKCVNQNYNNKYAFPAEQLSQGTIPYKEPSWSGSCEEQYKFEVLKNGTMLEGVDLTTKPFYVFGRLPSCDVTMEHPSLSRYHAVVQYCAQASEKHECGWYLYDLDSTHGTWINKTKIRPKVYHRLRVGHMVKFGGSSRLFILQGPETDVEEESELSITEMKEQRERQKREVEVLRLAEIEENERKLAELEKRRELGGCSWGMDDEEATDDAIENPFSAPDNEELYINDPKKSLKGFFEREGHDPPEYELSEAGFGKYKCQVELPIDTPTGHPVIAEVVISGKKKEAVVECALEACRILDRHGMLRNATHESKKRKQKNWEDDDFYDSDEDTFLDRTGDIEKKRNMRMKKAGKMESQAQTYDSLMSKHKAVVTEMEEIEAKLEKAKKDAEAVESGDIDALDAYMMSIKSGAMDTKTKMKLKCQHLELKKEELRLRKLINVAKPASLPELKKSVPIAAKPVDQKGLPIIGKRKIAEPGKKTPRAIPVQAPEVETNDFVEENDDDDEEEEKMETSTVQLSADRVSSSSGEITSVSSGEVTSTNTPEPTKPPKNLENTNNDRLSTPISASQEKSDIPPKDIEPTVKKSQPKKVKKNPPSEAQVEYDANDPDYAVWVPPIGQSGDGRTHLNDKYGY